MTHEFTELDRMVLVDFFSMENLVCSMLWQFGCINLHELIMANVKRNTCIYHKYQFLLLLLYYSALLNSSYRGAIPLLRSRIWRNYNCSAIVAL